MPSTAPGAMENTREVQDMVIRPQRTYKTRGRSQMYMGLRQHVMCTKSASSDNAVAKRPLRSAGAGNSLPGRGGGEGKHWQGGHWQSARNGYGQRLQGNCLEQEVALNCVR